MLSTALISCVKEQPVSSKEPEGIVLKLVVSGPETKATRDGIGSLNENAVANRVDIFFYNEETLVITKEALNSIVSGTLVQLPTNPNEMETVFGTMGSGATCGIFVVANFTGTYNGTAGSRTITDIKSSLLPAPNWLTLPQASFVMTGYVQATLRNAQGATPIYETVNLERVAAKISFDMTVASAAVEQEDGQPGNSWTPQTGSMSVYLVYAMRKATLEANPVMMPASANVTYQVGGGSQTMVDSQSEEYTLHDTGATKARTRGNSSVQCEVYSTDYTDEVDGETVSVLQPFYTYPMTWETGSAMEPYLKLIIPWRYGNVTRKYYYKIPFHGDALERNHWYHISIDVQILGTEQADPPEVDIYYSIADWEGTMDTSGADEIINVTSVPATVITARYLNVPTTEYILYDEDEVIIPIQTSHDVEVVGFNVDETNAYKSAHEDDEANYIGVNPSVYNPFLNTLNTSTVNGVRPNYQNDPPTPVTSASGWTITINERESITVTHPMNRNMSDANFDVAPYTIRFRVRHENDEDNYFSDVIIEQRPSIIIRPQRNSDDGDILSSTNSRGAGHTAEDGYVFINGVRTNTDQSSRRTNTNFNMYIVETSVLPSEGSLSEYVLGDPRSNTPVAYTSGLSANDFAEGKDIATGSTRRMANYYAGEEDDDHNIFIAPSFRIASSFGTSSSMNRATAVQRCATYQEDGYPAGRWRLPTKAEIEYMVTLSQKGKIPALFSAESAVRYGGYWCSGGAVFPLTDGTLDYRNLSEAQSMTVYYVSNGRDYTLGTGVHWARCVYDEWFWADTAHEKADKTVWTWGDELRSTVVKQ